MHHSVSERQEIGRNTKATLTQIFREEKAQSLPLWDACPASQASINFTQDPRAHPRPKTPTRFVPVLVSLFNLSM